MYLYFISQGRKWRIAEQFQTTSATVNNNTIYVGDIIQHSNNGVASYGRVKTFFSKVVKVNKFYVDKFMKSSAGAACSKLNSLTV